MNTSTTARPALNDVRTEVAKAVVGQDHAVTSLLIGLLAEGHVLLEGVPGVAKTLLVRSLSEAMELDNTRVQFTPDLMPGDVTGSLIYDASTSQFRFREGPVFTNLMLADEINRTPPKTQAALLEAMEEHQVSVDGTTYPLPEPFMVIATQNPIEYEGTYPLPEAQLDRFMLKVKLDLPSRDEEMKILNRHATGFRPNDLIQAGLKAVASQHTITTARTEIAEVKTSQEVLAYIVELVQATRSSPSLQAGVSPRGSTALMKCAKAWAWLVGRDFITPDDVQALLLPCLRHRVSLRPEAEMDGVSVDQVLSGLISTISVPR